MKKLYSVLLTFTCLLCINAKANAGTDVTGYVPHKIIIRTQDDFSTQDPPKNLSVVVMKEFTAKNAITVEKGTVFYLEVIKVNKEKIGKQNANAVARIVKAYVPSQDKMIDVTKINQKAYIKLSQYDKMDYMDLSLDTGISVANKFVKNVTYPAHFVKGAIKNESGDRFKSGFQETYDSSVLSYVGAGKPLILKSGDLATLTFYTKDLNANVGETTEIKNEE